MASSREKDLEFQLRQSKNQLRERDDQLRERNCQLQHARNEIQEMKSVIEKNSSSQDGGGSKAVAPNVKHTKSSRQDIAEEQQQCVWEEFVDSNSGATYYYNPHTQETSWNKPS